VGAAQPTFPEPAPAAPAFLQDLWWPRDEAWLSRPPSPFAGAPLRPLLIGGCPRSGTTLLRSLLDNHPDLAIPAETSFMFWLWSYRVRYGDLRDAANRRALAQWLFTTDGIGATRIRAGVPVDEAIERVAAAPPTLGSVFAACFELYADVHGKPRWGDKRPGHAVALEMMFTLFPDAQFINVVRDPRAAVASQVPLGWDEPEVALESAAVTWETAMRRVDRSARTLRPDQLLDVRYEDLVRRPAATLRRICRWAGLREGDAVDEMLMRERLGRFRAGWHDRLKQPITTGQIESWRGRLLQRDVALVEHVAAPYMQRFGYLPAASEAPAPAAVREVRRQRRRRARKFRRYWINERKRRLLLDRRPLAAISDPDSPREQSLVDRSARLGDSRVVV
jgi:hypothetical protein